MPNQLFYGDNLDVLKNEINDESIDLIYLDPPFNSKANYNVLFHSDLGVDSQAQIEAFEDTWHWNQAAEDAFDQVMVFGSSQAAEMLRSMRSFLHENDMMAYLAMMTIRLLELRRVLKQTGTIYLHCDPTASHYLKILLDAIFGPENFRNEISWKRSNPKSHITKNFSNCRDIIFRYTKNKDFVFNKIYGEHDPNYVKKAYKHIDSNGRRYRLLPLLNPNDDRPNLKYEFLGITRVWRWTKNRMEKGFDDGLVVQLKPGAVPQYKKYLEDSLGRTITNDWSDIKPIGPREELGYPTQKPLALLERIIEASSNIGDIVLDPFCGCGTTIHAAEKLSRKWIGIDITNLAISLIEKRLRDAFPGMKFEVHGIPKDIEGAKALAVTDKYQFQWWAISLVDAIPFGGKKKGADRGIDGIIYFKPDGKQTKKAIVSIKGGSSVGVSMIRELTQVVGTEKAEIGVFISLANPTKPMKTEAIKTGFYETEFGKYPKIQLFTIEELFNGKKPLIPLVDVKSGKRAKRESKNTQQNLF